VRCETAALIGRMRHSGCGGQPNLVELVTGVVGVTSNPLRRIVLHTSDVTSSQCSG
jgi:hypothetical protein